MILNRIYLVRYTFFLDSFSLLKFFVFKIIHNSYQILNIKKNIFKLFNSVGLNFSNIWSYKFFITLNFLNENIYIINSDYFFFIWSRSKKKNSRYITGNRFHKFVIIEYVLKYCEYLLINFESLNFREPGYFIFNNKLNNDDDLHNIDTNNLYEGNIIEIFSVWYELLLLVDYRLFFENTGLNYSLSAHSIIFSKNTNFVLNTIFKKNILKPKKYVNFYIFFINDYSIYNYFYWKNNYNNLFFANKKKKLLNLENNSMLNLLSELNIFLYLYKFFKNFFLSALIGFIFLYYSFFFFKLSFIKTLFNWIGLGLFVFWLLSTFNFFMKKYRFSKYTSAVQRFWKRAFMCFWMIEGFLFIIFFYYLLNASSEPYFMYDTYGLYINYLLSIKSFLINSFLIVVVLNLYMYLLLNTKFVSLRKNIYLLLFITLFLLYLLFVEAYQFYYISNYYCEYIWNFSEDEGVWELDFDIPRTRNKNHYITLIVVAKFWHYIFIFASWVFFLVKILELGRIRYMFLSMNFQNIILFYLMNWLCLYSWLKWILRRFLDQTYYWFFTAFRPVTINIIITDFFNYIDNLFNLSFIFRKLKFNFNFFYLNYTSSVIFTQYSFLKENSLIFLN